MARGRSHEKIDLLVLGGLALAYRGADQAVGGTLSATLGAAGGWAFVAGFLAGSLLLTPDLDIAFQTVNAKRRWGPLQRLWLPYGALFRHRGVSHTYLLGPATRLIYLALLLVPVALLAQAMGFDAAALGVPAAWLRDWAAFPWGRLLLAGCAGVYMANWSHLLVDGIVPFGGRVG